MESRPTLPPLYRAGHGSAGRLPDHPDHGTTAVPTHPAGPHPDTAATTVRLPDPAGHHRQPARPSACPRLLPHGRLPLRTWHDRHCHRLRADYLQPAAATGGVPARRHSRLPGHVASDDADIDPHADTAAAHASPRAAAADVVSAAHHSFAAEEDCPGPAPTFKGGEAAGQAGRQRLRPPHRGGLRQRAG